MKEKQTEYMKIELPPIEYPSSTELDYLKKIADSLSSIFYVLASISLTLVGILLFK